MNRRLRLALLAPALLSAPLHGGHEDELPVPRFEALESPAGERSQTPFLATTPDGSVLLSWLERDEADRHALRFARFARTGGGVWSPARTVAMAPVDSDRPAWFVNWADFPSIVSTGRSAPGGKGERLAAHLLVRHPGEGLAYDVELRWSTDGGASWGAPVLPHRDGTASEHGFVSLVPWEDGSVHAIWLDGRETGGGHGGHGHGGPMTLRAARLDAEGGLRDEAQLDARVCDCCQTAAVRTASGLLVAYRDRSAEEVRDVSLVRRTGEGWSRPAPLFEDGWRIEGCPVDGPALAARGDRVAAVWYTAAGDEPRVRAAFSTDGGASFGWPVTVDDGEPLGRPDVVWLSEEQVLVSWVERVPGFAEIRVRVLMPDREPGPSHRLTRTWPTRSSGFPRLTRLGDGKEFGVVAAWTDAAEPMRVRTAVWRR